MFALEVEYLTGRAVATERHKREEAEWPPHPGRLFSALVDAAFQGVSDDGRTLPDDIRSALEWLERLDAPSLAVKDAQRRDVMQVFVPVNDASTPPMRPGRVPSSGQIKDALAVLPDNRGRQPRYFPTVIPDSPLVHFVWENAIDADRHRSAFERLAACVAYLGHSSSLVRVAVIDTHLSITYRPDPQGEHQLRVPAPGRLADLEAHYKRDSRPSAGRYVAYSKVLSGTRKPAVRVGSAFGDMIVCEIQGPFLPLSGATRFLNAVRDAVLRASNEASPLVKTLVSGHTSDGGISHEGHIAYIPLANVGFNRYSDGKVHGFALVLPKGLARFSAERRAVLRAVAGVEGIGYDGYEWAVTIPTEDLKESLKTWPYTGPSKTWATVTPILCDRFPKDKDGEHVEDIVRQSIERVISEPIACIVVDKISKHLGVPPSHEFHRRRKQDAPPRHRVHAFVEFENEVRGPLIVGAGRYHGLGLFRVLKTEEQR